MFKKYLKTVCVIAAVAVTASVLGACSQKKPVQTEVEMTQNYGSEYPLSGNPKVTYWMPMNNALLSTDATMDTTPFAQGLKEKTGVEIEYMHPTAGQVNEQFNIMLASGDLPDIIEWNWYGFPGGPQKAINDNYIIKLNDVIEEYTPNLKKYIDENPEVARMLKTDDNAYYAFPFLRGDEILMTYGGPVVRKDWLDKLGMEPPETIDDWDVMLERFKNEMNATDPLLYHKRFMWAYGVDEGMYFDNGEIKYGPVQEGYRQYLTKMNEWLNAGYFKSLSVDKKVSEASIINGKTGALFTTGGSLGKYLEAGAMNYEGFNLVGVKYPVLKRGELSKFSQKDYTYAYSSSAAISVNCKDVEAAAKLLDFGYSEEGINYYNYGTEGVTYNMIEGYPTYTDEIMNNPDGLAPVNALGRYVRASYSGPFIQQKPYLMQYYETENQINALTTWLQADGNKNRLPLITMNSDESAEAANISAEITTYVDEMTAKFIMGIEPLDKFDSYVKQIEDLGLSRLLELNKKAVERYNDR